MAFHSSTPTRAVTLSLLLFVLAACGAKAPDAARTPDTATAPATPATPAPAPKATPSATPKVEPTATAAPAVPAPRPSTTPPAATASPRPTPTTTQPPRAAAAAPAPPPKRERIAVVNSCNKPVRLYFKRAGSDLQTSLNTSTRTEEPATDGDTLQLMDDTGRNELARMVITPSMKEIVIVAGCAKLESR